MANSGTPRHSKKARSGVTIELAPSDVSSVAEDLEVNKMAAEEIRAEPAAAAEPPQPEPAPEEFRSQPAAPARGKSALAGGLVGGALALAGAAGLQWAGALPSSGSGAEVAAIRQQIAALAEKPGAAETDPAALDALAAGQAAVSKSVESLNAGLAAVNEAQKLLAEEVSALKSSGGAAGADSSALTEKLVSLEAQLDAIKENDASAKIAEVQAQITALTQNAGKQTGASNVAQAIAAAGLKAAIDRGGSFASELETFATVAPASPELEQLKNLAASGVPSKAELSAEFGNAADAILAATQTVDPNAGLIARLTASAKGLVRSRPVGAVEGDTPEALVARMEVAVNKGDLDAALVEAGKLPDAARAAGIGYIGRLTARRDTDALVTRALTSALSAAGEAK